MNVSRGCWPWKLIFIRRKWQSGPLGSVTYFLMEHTGARFTSARLWSGIGRSSAQLQPRSLSRDESRDWSVPGSLESLYSDVSPRTSAVETHLLLEACVAVMRFVETTVSQTLGRGDVLFIHKIPWLRLLQNEHVSTKGWETDSQGSVYESDSNVLLQKRLQNKKVTCTDLEKQNLWKRH